ncbi:MAG: toprim domain-containing protein [Gammaproteobacteria bacterium]|nr:toprim domain-containing protein [Gammaproteobacteria bacterium]
MPTIEQLKNDIDLHDLADRLGWQRPGGKGNYSAPNRDDKSPSVSINSEGKYFKDHTGAGQGSCIDMMMYHYGTDDVGEAVKMLHELYGWPLDKPEPQQHDKKEYSIAEHIAYKCSKDDPRIFEYLNGRAIENKAIEQAIKKGTLALNDYCNPKYQPGERFYGGPAVAFITKGINTPGVVGVDVRYLEPELNGDLKTMSHGEKDVPWTSDPYRLKKAKSVYFVESPINALSIDSCDFHRSTAAVATKGTEQTKTMDLYFMLGKQAIICMDNDEKNKDGKCPGPEASWVLYERLTAMGVACQMVEQIDWKEQDPSFNDVNDVLQAKGVTELRICLKKFEEWAIAGLAGKTFDGRKSRLYLPSHDYSMYWRFKCREDFTSFVSEKKENPDGGEDISVSADLCGFRIASLSRINIAGATSVMSGEDDTQENTLFAVSVQTPRHGSKLIKRVFEDERLHNLTHWSKFGPIFMPQQFNRLINILERGAHLGARDAVNFVGVAWKQGKLVVNEGNDCYFTEPDKQCPYHNLTFPSGPTSDALRVINAYQSTFTDNAAMMPLVWALGGHLKSILSFWPHFIIQAEKGAGKSVLTERLERTIAFTMFSGQSLQTEFRLLTTISHTSHPVGWEELSARGQMVIDKAVALLQESYRYTITRRGSDMTEYLISAPVLLAGEDVPVKSLLGKVARTQLSKEKQGERLPENLPRFPMRQWLEFIAEHSREQVQGIFNQAHEYVKHHCRDSNDDSGADRMRENYAAVLTAWRLLCDFAGIDTAHGNFKADCMAEMNMHIADSSNERDPWVWILETIFDEISSGKFFYPHKFLYDTSDGHQRPCLAIRHSHIISHLKNSPALKGTWDSLPVKSKGVLLTQLKQAGVILRDRIDITINKHRESHLIALDLEQLNKYGLHVSMPEDLEHLSDGPLHSVPPAQSEPQQQSF